MKAKDWTPTKEQQQQWEEQGYFVLRNVVPQDLAFDLRGVIKNELLKPEPEGNPDADPMDPMGNTPEAKAITRRYRLRLVPGHAVIPSMEVKTRPLYGMPMTLHPRT